MIKNQSFSEGAYQQRRSWFEYLGNWVKLTRKNIEQLDLEKAASEFTQTSFLGRFIWFLPLSEQNLFNSLKLTKKCLLDFGCLSQKSDAVLSCILYALSSILLTLCNKHVFSSQKFDYPWCSLGFQMLTAAIFVLFLGSWGMIDFAGFDKELFIRLIIPNLGFVGFLFSGSRSLRYVRIPMLSVLKSLAPVGIAVFESVYYQEMLSMCMLASFIMMIIGNIIAGYNDITFSFWGYVWAVLNVLCNIIYVVYHNSILSLFWMTILAFICGEWTDFGSSFVSSSTTFKLSFVMSGILGIGISAASFYCIASTSGTTFSFVGSVNKVPVILLGWLIFDTEISFGSWVGVAIGLFASFLFTYANTRTTKSSCRHKKVPSSSSAMTSTETYARVLSEEEREQPEMSCGKLYFNETNSCKELNVLSNFNQSTNDVK
ncbi:GDP-mannose transporter [Galdieria sulphuraria]|nr:GDP-mannose transporter [Galdieria sulphuraria]